MRQASQHGFWAVGASWHMTGDFGDFVGYRDLPNTNWVAVANGHLWEARGRGSVRLVVDQEEPSR